MLIITRYIQWGFHVISLQNTLHIVFVTRLHMRYDQHSMIQDPVFKHTKDKTNFQGRYAMNHPFAGNVNCESGREYVKQIRQRLRKEATELAGLTGWRIREIEKRIRRRVPKSY